jgi:methyl coenzyme M reductase gamma subunit
MNYYHRNQSNGWLFLTGLTLGAILSPILKMKFYNSDRWQMAKDRIKEKYDRGVDAGQSIYEQMVDEVTDKYAKTKGISRNELTDLVDDLKMHWGRIREAWNE